MSTESDAPLPPDLQVAVVHEWFDRMAGAERVVEQIHAIFPGADLFALVNFLPQEERGLLRGKSVSTSFIQKLPLARHHFRKYLPLMPLAIRRLDVSRYDLVISSNHAVAKGVRTHDRQLHVSYVHTPMRYAWDMQDQYLRDAGIERGPLAWGARWILNRFRRWDADTARKVDVIVANSDYIARRIQDSWRRESVVIYPPVDTNSFTLREDKEDFYLAASRLVPYKRMDLIVEAFSCMPQRRLVVIGDGPQAPRIRGIATSNISLLGYQPDHVLRDYMQRARAFVFAAEEDFGILPVESQACGTPVIALAKGGALETVRGFDRDDPTGMFFADQTVDSVINAVENFDLECVRIEPANCRRNAERFSVSNFRYEFTKLIAEEWDSFSAKTKGIKTVHVST